MLLICWCIGKPIYMLKGSQYHPSSINIQTEKVEYQSIKNIVQLFNISLGDGISYFCKELRSY